jgi:hypothetical protein
MQKINLGDKVEDLITGFVGIVETRIECLNGCIRYGLVEAKVKGVKNGMGTIEVDSQQVKKIDDGINKYKKIKKTEVGGKMMIGKLRNN